MAKAPVIAFEISQWLPTSKNKSMGRGGGFRVQADKLVVEKFATMYAGMNDWPTASPMERGVAKQVDIIIRKGPRGKVEDYDNLVHYAKSILDGLTACCHCKKCLVAVKRNEPRPKFHKKVGAALLWDDSPDWCSHTLTQAWGAWPGTIITVRDR